MLCVILLNTMMETNISYCMFRMTNTGMGLAVDISVPVSLTMECANCADLAHQFICGKAAVYQIRFTTIRI